jgi:hypothetical protein
MLVFSGTTAHDATTKATVGGTTSWIRTSTACYAANAPIFSPMQQQFAPQPMPGQGVGPPGSLPMNLQGSAVRQNAPGGDDQSDPLFMLKDL